MGCGYFSGRYRQQLKCHVCLLVGLRPPTPHRSLRSLCRRGFVHYVRLRHYRSSLFCGRKIIPSHSFAALTALVVRHVNGNVALLVRRVDGFVDQPRLACTSRRTPPVGALACALGGGTLPPVLWHLLFSAKGLLQLYQSRMRLSIGAAEFFTIFLSWSGKGGEIQLLRAARKAEGETP